MTRALLVIADIGGYTDYMLTHRMCLAHAQVNTARLLDRVVDAVPGFDLVEVEGDAAFLSRDADGLDPDEAVAETLRAAVAMHRAFHVERRYIAANLCPCESCSEAEKLKLKFVAHVGEVATQTIRDRRKLVGIDVILVHRLLKNPVAVPEYVLLSQELYESADPVAGPVHEISHDLEGIGPVQAYFVEVADLDGTYEPVPAPTWGGRIGRTLRVAGLGLPPMLGIRRRKIEPVG